MEQIKHCPFCGATKCSVDTVEGCFRVVDETYYPVFAVSCDYCDSSGQVMPTKEEAIERWNKRIKE